MKKRVLVFCLVGALLLLGMAGCKGRTEDPEGTGAQTQTEKKEFPRDGYSPITVKFGENSVRGKQYFWHGSHYGKDAFNASGAGAMDIFEEDGTPKDEDIPTVTAGGDISVEVPEGATLETKVRIEKYGTNEAYATVDGFAALASLEQGQYVIRYTEILDTRFGDESITDYTITSNECVFYLIVE